MYLILLHSVWSDFLKSQNQKVVKKKNTLVSVNIHDALSFYFYSKEETFLQGAPKCPHQNNICWIIMHPNQNYYWIKN